MGSGSLAGSESGSSWVVSGSSPSGVGGSESWSWSSEGSALAGSVVFSDGPSGFVVIGSDTPFTVAHEGSTPLPRMVSSAGHAASGWRRSLEHTPEGDLRLRRPQRSVDAGHK